MKEIGAILKDLRLKKGLTQEELADRCELTKGYISQLENDLTSPSIITLEELLNALGMSMGEFFSEAEEEKQVFTEVDYSVKQREEAKLTWLIPSAQKNMMEPILFELEPGAESEKDVPHEGEEFGYVLAGKLKLCVGRNISEAGQGDSFYFRAGKTHYIKNIGKNKARILWVSCPPNF